MCSSVQALLRVFRFGYKYGESFSKWFTQTASERISLKAFQLRRESGKYLYSTTHDCSPGQEVQQ